jgi:beta-lactamase class A
MPVLVTRRHALLGSALLLPIGCAPAAVPARSGASEADAAQGLRELETRCQGRLGVATLDSGSGRQLGQRQHERFPLCSTFKLLAVAAVLARVDRGEERLDRRVAFSEVDLLEHAPVARARLSEGGLLLGELCAAAITVSDNTAANLILASLGGPPGLTAYLRTLGDSVTRLDRNEPLLNEALPGDERDTTTPAAMLSDLRVLLLEDALSPGSRARLMGWLVANTTGDELLRAGVPKGWRVGDKTGSGERGVKCDVAILWPPDHEPILVAAYLSAPEATAMQRESVFVDVARRVSAGV